MIPSKIIKNSLKRPTFLNTAIEGQNEKFPLESQWTNKKKTTNERKKVNYWVIYSHLSQLVFDVRLLFLTNSFQPLSSSSLSPILNTCSNHTSFFLLSTIYFTFISSLLFSYDTTNIHLNKKRKRHVRILPVNLQAWKELLLTLCLHVY